jgi:hypothetical protein
MPYILDMRQLISTLQLVLFLSCFPPLDNAEDGKETKPVLIAIANNGFYFQEYADPRLALEESGLTVVVTAGDPGTAIPHSNTGQPPGLSGDTPVDLPFNEVDPGDLFGSRDFRRLGCDKLLLCLYRYFRQSFLGTGPQ